MEEARSVEEQLSEELPTEDLIRYSPCLKPTLITMQPIKT